jgi:fumarate reductase subunit C
MNKPAVYTEYHPRWYRPRKSTWWWLKRGSYLVFILRELSSVFVLWFVIYLLLMLRAVGQGWVAYYDFLNWAAHPAVVAVNVVSLFFLVFHSLTWFHLAPQALAVRLGGKRVPGRWIAAANYAAWGLVSVLVAWLFLGVR